jgi:hypothetical protein
VPAGKTVSLKLPVRNEGNVPAAGSATLELILSSDPSGDPVVATSQPSAKVSIKPGATKALKLKLGPAPATPGTYYLLVKLNGIGLLGNLNETNGGLVGTVQVTVT